MAIFLIGLSTIIFLLLTFIIVFLLNYKEGKFVKRNSMFIIIVFVILIGLFINTTAIPSNYIKERLICITLIVLTLLSLFLYKNKFNVSRILLSFIALISMLIYV
ncbi:hypothetical protein [Romboutsia lituseburensis]|uniref:hypothetical protein n=1 Tax=Romboutsia lituseburensis TaxID=1537 RepID=UPI00215AEA5F|nr:hypothetical protein [Romboutsia lituseburensis]MCR8744141.1 hypothetical protein [Romboutsia lituseburensis]